MSDASRRNFWKRNKPTIAACGVVASIALAIAVPFVQAPLCSVSKPQSYSRADGAAPNGKNQEASRPQTTNARLAGVAAKLGSKRPQAEENSTRATDNAALQEENWGRTYWCDVRATDYFLVLFTLALAVSTFFLWRETEKLAEGAADQSKKMEASIKVMERQARNMRLAQRPYLVIRDITLAPFEGAVPGPTDVALDNGESGILAVIKCTFENRGKGMCRVLGASFISNTGSTIGPMPAPDTSNLYGDFIVGEGSVFDPGLPVCTCILPKDLKWRRLEFTYVCGWVRYVDLFGIIRRHPVAYEYLRPTNGRDTFGDHFITCGPGSYWDEVEEPTED